MFSFPAELLRKGNEPYRKAVMAKITAALEQDVRASTPQRRILDFGVAALIRANVGNLPRCLNCFAEVHLLPRNDVGFANTTL